jgi:hypothetical protein
MTYTPCTHARRIGDQVIISASVSHVILAARHSSLLIGCQNGLVKELDHDLAIPAEFHSRKLVIRENIIAYYFMRKFKIISFGPDFT